MDMVSSELIKYQILKYVCETRHTQQNRLRQHRNVSIQIIAVAAVVGCIINNY